MKSLDHFEDQILELQQAVTNARAAIDRMDFHRRQLAAEFEKVRAAEIFTEDEAAEFFKVTPRTMADYRRKFNLPHIGLGQGPRYTRRHLEEIARVLEVRSRAAGQKAA